MSSSHPAPAHPETDLVEMHRQTLRRLWRVQRNAVLVPLVLLVALVGYIWFRLDDFCKNKAPLILTEVVKQSPQYMGPVLGSATDSLGRLAPIYSQAIQKVYHRDFPIYKQLIELQKAELTKYAQSQQLVIEKHVGQLSAKLLGNVERHLAPDLTTREREAFEQAVAQSIYQRLKKELDSNWMTQIKQLKSISNDLYTISITTPQVPSKNSKYMTGVGLELLGRKLQEYSK